MNIKTGDWIALTNALSATPEITPADLARKAALLIESRKMMSQNLHQLKQAVVEAIQMLEDDVDNALDATIALRAATDLRSYS